MATFHLKIIAYDKIFYDDEAVSVCPACCGWDKFRLWQIIEEYVIALKEGEVRITTPDGKNDPGSLRKRICGGQFR